MPRKIHNHDFTRVAQRRDASLQYCVVRTIRRKYSGHRRATIRHGSDIPQVQAEAGCGTRPPESPAHFVITAAERQRVRAAVGINREHDAAVIVKAPQFAEIEANFGRAPLHRGGDRPQLRQRASDLRIVGQPACCDGKNPPATGQLRQCQQCLTGTPIKPKGPPGQRRHVLGLNRAEKLILQFRRHAGASDNGAKNTDMPDVQLQTVDTRQPQGIEHQALYLEIALNPGVTVDLRPDLQRLA